MSEKLVGIANKFYSARSTLKTLYPVEFDKRCIEWQKALKTAAERKDISELDEVINIMKARSINSVSVMWLMAAYVEMVEPSV